MKLTKEYSKKEKENLLDECVRMAGSIGQLAQLTNIHLSTLNSYYHRRAEISQSNFAVLHDYKYLPNFVPKTEAQKTEPIKPTVKSDTKDVVIKAHQKLIKEAIKKAGSQKKLAMIVGVSPCSISLWATGKAKAKIGPKSLCKIDDFMKGDLCMNKPSEVQEKIAGRVSEEEPAVLTPENAETNSENPIELRPVIGYNIINKKVVLDFNSIEEAVSFCYGLSKGNVLVGREDHV